MSEYDVVVVGAGAAGLAASIEAADGGSKVLMIDGSESVGGSSRFSGGIIMGADTPWQKEQGINDTADALYDFYMAVNQWNVTPGPVWRLAKDAGPAIEWIATMGADIMSNVITSADEPVPRGHAVVGMGAALIDVLHSAVRSRPNIDVALKQRIDHLLVEDGRVTGVASGSDRVSAHSTVVTTGGFGANFGALAKYAPKGLRAGDWAWYVGAETAQGDAFAFWNQMDVPLIGRGRVILSARPNFGRDNQGEFPGWLVIVDDGGRRFFNEMTPYSAMEHVMMDVPGQMWAIFDEGSKTAASASNIRKEKKVHRPDETVSDWVEESIDYHVSQGTVRVADSIEHLAHVIGVPAANLQGTVEVYNEGVVDGRDAMFRKRADTMRPISKPPFYATEIRLHQVGITGTGPMMSENCEVIGADSRPVEGLFAAGECTGGILGSRYVGSGNSLANSLALGRAAGGAARDRAAIFTGDEAVVS